MTDRDNHSPEQPTPPPKKRRLKLSDVSGGLSLKRRKSGEKTAKSGGLKLSKVVALPSVTPPPATDFALDDGAAILNLPPAPVPDPAPAADPVVVRDPQGSPAAADTAAAPDTAAPEASTVEPATSPDAAGQPETPEGAPPPAQVATTDAETDETEGETDARTDTGTGTEPKSAKLRAAEDAAYQQRLKARAQLLCRLASLRGVPPAPQDMVEHLQSCGDASLRPEAMTSALVTAGLKARIVQLKRPSPRHWPGIAIMQGGQPVLVLSQGKAGVTVYDTSCPDNRAEVPMQDFMPFFTGQILTARATVAQLAQRHTPQLDNSHWFWGEFPKYRRQIGEVMLGSLVANLLAVAVALFSLQVYDRVVPHQSQATLWVLAIGALMAIAMEGMLKLARARITDASGRQIDLAVQHKLMRRVIGLRMDQSPLPPSGLFAAMRDFSSVREFFTSSTLSTLADVPFIAVFLLLVASIGGPVVYVIIIGGILMLLPGYFIQKKMLAMTRLAQGASSKSGRLLHEVVSEMETIKTQRGEERILRQWDELNLLSSQASNGQRKLASALTYWSQGVQQATYISAVILGTYMVFAGEFTVGTIIATGILTSRTLAPLTQFAGTLARWSNVRAALDALDVIADAKQERETGRAYLRRDQIQGRFELREVVFRYDPEGAPNVDVPAVAVTPGQRVAVLGVNGSGKSTLLKLLAGLYTPQRGRVMIDGTDMSQIEPRDLRRHIGYLGQEVKLFAGTLRDNLNLSLLSHDDARVMEALEFAGLAPFVQSHPRGLDLMIGDGGSGLSIGQRQAVGWARLHLQNPSVVLLDEPTAALDQTLERTLVSRLDAWLETRTAIIATHRMPILSLTNRTLILQAGRMVVDGPRDEVLAHLNGKAKAS
ncbi:ATP-binding cassette domain-containing protein [Tritonibacter horizontis]|uniref:Toxin RTX-I translocation ATP-binding protein n=1 Tax=Tritonibacter horizontis TaxID=1768241 RepID=A0A132BYH7_9RHOB|nr:ATP-binding cassette domain-containing protein [Tritonibacter horizontis]KUP93453.1 toxin RTX-I translocation ATP-binding protein [Tritonibacter horizontis]